jgi:hypothetical protein
MYYFDMYLLKLKKEFLLAKCFLRIMFFLPKLFLHLLSQFSPFKLIKMSHPEISVEYTG